MKKILILLLLAVSLTAWGTAYYVKTGGNDDLAGTSDATAWATLTKVQSSTFTAGDSILFRRGDTFRGALYRNGESGTDGNYIYFGAYGIGAKPKILGAKDISATGDWEVHSGNIWKTTATIGVNQSDISNLIFNNESSVGWKHVRIDSLDAQGDFFHDPATDLLYIYSASNPGSFYTHIEAAGHYDVEQGLFKWTNCDYIYVENLDLRYSSGAGIEFRACDHLKIMHNDVGWIGGELFQPGEFDGERIGNGISLILGITDVEIAYNYVYQCYDAGISPQGWGTYTQSNISIHHNIVDKCYWSYETWTLTGCTSTNVHFVNNTLLNAGDQWSQAQRPDNTQPWHIKIGHDEGTVTNCTIKNNIIYSASGLAIRFGYSITKYLSDYNLYYDNTNLAYGYPLGSFATLAAWQAAQSTHDQNSISGDPLFISASDFRIQASSPAKDAGTGYGYDVDYEGIKIGYLPDIGAFEYEDIRMVTTSGSIILNESKIVTIRR